MCKLVAYEEANSPISILIRYAHLIARDVGICLCAIGSLHLIYEYYTKPKELCHPIDRLRLFCCQLLAILISYKPSLCFWSIFFAFYLDFAIFCIIFALVKQVERRVGKGTDLSRIYGRQYEELPVLTLSLSFYLFNPSIISIVPMDNLNIILIFIYLQKN